MEFKPCEIKCFECRYGRVLTTWACEDCDWTYNNFKPLTWYQKFGDKIRKWWRERKTK